MPGWRTCEGSLWVLHQQGKLVAFYALSSYIPVRTVRICRNMFLLQLMLFLTNRSSRSSQENHLFFFIICITLYYDGRGDTQKFHKKTTLKTFTKSTFENSLMKLTWSAKNLFENNIWITSNPLINAFIRSVYQISISSSKTQNLALCVARIPETRGEECKMNMWSIQTTGQSAAASESMPQQEAQLRPTPSVMRQRCKNRSRVQWVCTVWHPKVKLLRQLLCALCGFATPSGATDLLHAAVAIQSKNTIIPSSIK